LKGIPSALSGARLLTAPVLAHTILNGRLVAALVVLVGLALTDVLDGLTARALRATTASGAYLDACADFAVVAAGFGSLAVLEVYPWWLLGVFALMFGQFLATSAGAGPPHYDPVGKHYGVALYGALGLTLAFPDLAVAQAITSLLLVLTVVSLTSRVADLLGFRSLTLENTILARRQSG
jgi:phosphatidylglycerophosphate synthase